MNHPTLTGRGPGAGPASQPNLPWTDLGSLSPRQREIARLIARSHTDREIGADLDLDRALVADQVEHLRQVLGFDTRLQIAALVQRQDPLGGDQESGQAV